MLLLLLVLLLGPLRWGGAARPLLEPVLRSVIVRTVAGSKGLGECVLWCDDVSGAPPWNVGRRSIACWLANSADAEEGEDVLTGADMCRIGNPTLCCCCCCCLCVAEKGADEGCCSPRHMVFVGLWWCVAWGRDERDALTALWRAHGALVSPPYRQASSFRRCGFSRCAAWGLLWRCGVLV